MPGKTLACNCLLYRSNFHYAERSKNATENPTNHVTCVVVYVMCIKIIYNLRRRGNVGSAAGPRYSIYYT